MANKEYTGKQKLGLALMGMGGGLTGKDTLGQYIQGQQEQQRFDAEQTYRQQQLDMAKMQSQIEMAKWVAEQQGKGQDKALDFAGKTGMVQSQVPPDRLAMYQDMASKFNKPFPYSNVGGQYYRSDPNIVRNVAQMKPNTGSNFIIPQSLTTPESNDLVGQDVLSKLDPNTQAGVKGVLDYSLGLDKITSMRGNQRMQLAELAKRVDPTFDMKLYPARQDYMKNVYGGDIYRNALSLNTLAAHIDNFDQTIEKAHMAGQPIANAVMFYARNLSGDPTITDIKTAKEVIDTEIQRSLTNAAVTQEGLNAQRKLQKLDLSSYKQAKQYAKSIAHIADQRGGQMEEAFVQRMGKPSNGLIINPSARSIYSKLSGKYTQMGTNSKGQRVGKLADGTVEVISGK